VNRTVAVTGATGFIGGHLVQRLVAEGWRVHVLVRRPETHSAPDSILAGPAIETVPGSLEDPASLHDLLRGVDAVVHVAGLVKARSRTEFFRVNAAGVANVVKIAAEQSPSPHFILISSLAAREPDLSAYAASKHAGEAVLGDFGRSVPWTILRPPVVYGPGDPNSLIFFRMIAKGLAPLPASDTARLSLLHVADLSAAIVAVLSSGPATFGGTYEVDDGQAGGYSWPTIVATAGENFSKPLRTFRVPKAILQGVARLVSLAGLVLGRAPMLSPGKVREIYHPDWVCRGGPLSEQTNWRPQRSLKDGFANVIDWYRRNRCL